MHRCSKTGQGQPQITEKGKEHETTSTCRHRNRSEFPNAKLSVSLVTVMRVTVMRVPVRMTVMWMLMHKSVYGIVIDKIIDYILVFN